MTAGQLASSYQLVRAESGAAAALLNHVDGPVVEALTGLVGPRGANRLVQNHLLLFFEGVTFSRMELRNYII